MLSVRTALFAAALVCGCAPMAHTPAEPAVVAETLHLSERPSAGALPPRWDPGWVQEGRARHEELVNPPSALPASKPKPLPALPRDPDPDPDAR